MQQRVRRLFSVSPEATEKEAEQDRFNIVTEWRSGLASESVCRDAYDRYSHSFAVYADEPHALRGQGAFPNPQSLLLAAFNACMIATLVTEEGKANPSLTLLKIETWGKIAAVIAEQRIPHSSL